MITERQYKYWLTRHCKREFCWVVAARLGEMISHSNTKFKDEKGQSLESITLTHDSMEYIYFAVVDKDKLLTLVEDQSGFYLIENNRDATEMPVNDTNNDIDNDTNNDIDNEDQETLMKIDSIITYAKTLDGIIGTLSSGKSKQLGIKKRDKAKLKPSDLKALEKVVHIDFINKSLPEKQQLWNTFVRSIDGSLDLSGFHTLSVDIIKNGPGNKNITDIILYQNINIYDFSWLEKFVNLSLLSIWFINMIQDEHIETLVGKCNKLTVFEIHHCYQVSGRCLIALSKLPLLSRIIIDNDQLSCQSNPFSTVIKRNEWATIKNNNVEFLMINSNNLTLDYIDFTLKSFMYLKKFVMNDIILDKLYKNSVSGHEDKKDEYCVTFQSASDVSRGFVRYRDIKVFDLLCSKVDDNVYSDSMLRVIKKQNPEKARLIEVFQTENC